MSNQGAAQEPTMEEILASIRRIISEDSGGKEEAEEAAAPPPAAAPEPEPEPEVDFEAELDAMLDPEPEPEPEPEMVEFEEPEPAPMPVAAAEPVPAPASEPDFEEDDVVFSEEDILELTEPLEPEPEPLPEPEPEPEYEPEPEPEYQPAPEPMGHQQAAFAPEPEDEDIAFEEPAMTAHTNYSEPAGKPLMSQDAAQAASAAFGALASSMLTSAGGSKTLEDLVAEMLRPMLKDWLDNNLPGLVEQMVREEIERVARRGR